MKIEEAIKVLTDFNKWRRGEPPYEWNEDPSKQKELSYSAKEVGLAIDEAINMLKREKKYEYAIEFCDYRGKWVVYTDGLTLVQAQKLSFEKWRFPHRIVRRDRVKLEEV